MNNKGFIMMETIVAVVILTASLLILYSSFTSILKKEKTRVFYDDPAYIYRTLYLKDALTSLDLNTYLDTYLNNTDNYFITLGMDSENLFLNDNFISYLKTINFTSGTEYGLVVYYNTCNSRKICQNYYSWVSV